jgi:hypothetical protein
VKVVKVFHYFKKILKIKYHSVQQLANVFIVAVCMNATVTLILMGCAFGSYEIITGRTIHIMATTQHLFTHQATGFDMTDKKKHD